MNYRKYKIKTILFIIAASFLLASSLIIFLNIRKIARYKNGEIIKIEANIESIGYYEYGILKKKHAYTVYGLELEGKKIILTNMENKTPNENAVNSKAEIYYDKLNDRITKISVLPNFALAFIFFAFGMTVLIYSLKLNDLYIWSESN